MKRYIPIRSVLALALVCSTTSCTTVRDQKYLQKGSLSNIRRILVVTSSEDLTVQNARVPLEPEHSRGQGAKDLAIGGAAGASQMAGAAANFFGVEGVTGIALRASPLVIPAAVVVGVPILWGVQSGKDASQAKTLRSAEPKETIAQRLSEHFTKTLLEAGAFDSVQETPTGAEDEKVREQLRSQDGLVRLRVNQVCLRRVSAYGLSLVVEVSAEMVSLKNGKEDALLWSRHENLESGEVHPMESYRTNGIPMLDVSLAKLAKRLADDIIYSK